MGIRLTDSDVVVVCGVWVFAMPLLGVTNPLESGSTKEASKKCKRILGTRDVRFFVSANLLFSQQCTPTDLIASQGNLPTQDR